MAQRHKSIFGVSCATARQGQRRIIRHYGKVFEVLVRSPIVLPSYPCPSAADQLATHALPALPNTWLGHGYLRGRNQDIAVRGGVPIASGSRHSVVSDRRLLAK